MNMLFLRHCRQYRKWLGIVIIGFTWLGFNGLSQAQAAATGSAEFIVSAERGSDITVAVQQAIDEARASGGGTVVLPPGNFTVSDTIKFTGTLQRFPRGGATLNLRGGPTHLTYKGAPHKTILDMEAPNNCTISSLSIDGDNVPGTVGIRYRAGYERGVNGGKSNNFFNVNLARLDIGLWIGDPFAPDLVGSGFYSLGINYTRIGMLLEGANVAGMTFYNPIFSGYREAGIKLVGQTGRLIRRTEADPRPPAEVPDTPSVLTNIQTGEEIFEKDVPEYALKNRASKRMFQGQEYYWAPGGAPEMTVYNANFGGQAANAWAIDTNWGNIRLYSARVEGVQGFFRRSSTISSGRFTDIFTDVNVTSYGTTTGNVMEYHGPGPFYLYGGIFSGNVALGNNTQVFATGTRFEKGKFPFYPGLVPPGYELPANGAVKRTGKQEIFPGRFGMYDVVQVAPVEKPGFVQLPGTGNATVHGLAEKVTGTLAVPTGQTKVVVRFTRLLPGNSYQITAVPAFDAGTFWVSEKTAAGFTLNFKTPAPASATIDWAVHYQTREIGG